MDLTNLKIIKMNMKLSYFFIIISVQLISCSVGNKEKKEEKRIAENEIYKTEINLFNETLNGKDIKSLNIDSVTNILGRPSATEKPDELMEEFKGPKLFYSELGLQIAFFPKKIDSLQRIQYLTIYLTNNSKEKEGIFYNSFLSSCNLFPKMNGNMKNVDVLQIFKNKCDSISFVSAEKWNDDLKKLYKGLDIKPTFVTNNFVFIYNKNVKIVTYHEELTNYLESISLSIKR